MMTKKRLRKLTAISTAILMLLTICSQATSAAASPAATDPLEPYPETIVIHAGRAVASDFKFYGDESIDSNAWTEAYKEKLNIEIDNMWVVDPSQAATKMNSAIASGSYPDVFTVNPTDYAKYAASGVIADVTDLYATGLSENGKLAVNADDGYSLDAISIGGRLYGIPIVDNPLDSVNVLFIRQDWLDKVGLSVPKTIDEFIKVAEAFVTQDPDGNGKNDTYALALDGKNICSGWGGLEPFFEMYGAYPLAMSYATNFSLVEDNQGGLRWGGDTQAMQEALTTLQMFYKNRWIAQDFGTHDDPKAIQEFGNGKCGMFFAPMWGAWSAAETLFANYPDAVVVASPLPGKEGYGKAFYVSSLSAVAVVNSKCATPDALFKIFCFGKELVAYQKDQAIFDRFNGDAQNFTGSRMSITDPLRPLKNLDNFYKISEAVKTGDTSNLDSEQMNNYSIIKKQYLDSPVPTRENISDFAAGYGLWSVFANPDGGYAAVVKAKDANAFQPAGYAPAPTERMAAVGSTLTDLIATNIIKIVYGENDPAYWDTVVKNWHELGGNTVLEDANAWFKAK